ncbi:MAG: hypothetical protein A3G34_04750 [Candidatus Lindowbacteria bacterium RIFCSPLOWO2_12_FULL_62_27]|nr:MAG: hypothetical protein A3I06_13070 [Candidatus Lindowbacteria bacterium RIFCSPLOWO2_02_FULL_62_12]OGH61307.1 MAG: hypothetical protein A3G34_04750 [Candidatus Lindowbacteria bacterium RIFCSPLOWO2_12_FULL_62_27]
MTAAGAFGPYKLLRELGHGGMGVVHLAEDAGGRTVALKILPEHLSRNERFRERFSRECASLRRLSHPGIPQLYDEGESEGHRYLAMEFIDAEGLDSLMSRHAGPLPPELAARILRDTADILAYAHRQGVIHRDVSPRNIILTKQGEVKMIDFGIAKLVDEITLTMTGQHMGTPAYMAPEQFGAAGSKAVDARADLWSLGILGFQMLTGRLPYEGENQVSLIRQIIDPTSQPPSVLDVHPDAPDGLARVVDRLLQRNPAHRYQTAGDLAQAVSDRETLPAEAFDPSRRYALDGIVYLPFVKRWAVVDEQGVLKKTRYLGLVHQGGASSRRACGVGRAAAGVGDAVCAECSGSVTAGGYCRACGLVSAEALPHCKLIVSRESIALRRRFRRQAVRMAGKFAAVVGVAALVYWGWVGLRPPQEGDVLIDANAAGFQDLVKIPGMGEKRALFLLAWRHNRGAFKDVRQVEVVLSMMTSLSATLSGVLSRLKVETPDAAPPDAEFLKRYRRVDINRAGEGELMSTPFISEKSVPKIIRQRMAAGAFRTLQDIMEAMPAALVQTGSTPWMDFVSLGDTGLDREYRKAVDRYYADQLIHRARWVRYEKSADIVLDANSAGFSDLVKIRKMNAERAHYLISFRTNHGAFRDTRDVRAVLSWTGKLSEEILPQLKVESREVAPPDPQDAGIYSRVNINAADLPALLPISLIRQRDAEVLLARRKTSGPFRTLEDVLNSQSKSGVVTWLDFISLGNPALDRTFQTAVHEYYAAQLAAAVSVPDRLDLNHASQYDLIARVKAPWWVFYIMMRRHKVGAFESVDAFLEDVKRYYETTETKYSEKLPDQFRQVLYVTGDRTVTVDPGYLRDWGTPLNLTSASDERINAIPFLRRDEKEALLALRKNRRLRSMNDLLNIMDKDHRGKQRTDMMRDFLTVK